MPSHQHGRGPRLLPPSPARDAPAPIGPRAARLARYLNMTWLAAVAGVVVLIVSMALIMMAVFSIFATLPLIDLKILGIGIGTAAAVLIDATVVRPVWAIRWGGW